jgi:hypothetical protein
VVGSRVRFALLEVVVAAVGMAARKHAFTPPSSMSLVSLWTSSLFHNLVHHKHITPRIRLLAHRLSTVADHEMSQSQRSESIGNRLRATATAFTLQTVAGTRPSLERNQHTSYSSYSTVASSDISTYSESSDRTTHMSIRSTDSQPNTTISIINCDLCASLDQILDCCASNTGPHSRPCSRCAKVSQLFAYEKREHDYTVITLQARVLRPGYKLSVSLKFCASKTFESTYKGHFSVSVYTLEQQQVPLPL